MNTYLAAAILLQVVAADFKGAAGSVSQSAADLAGSVSSWSSGDGLQGALGIQGGFGGLSSAVGDLSNSAGSASDSDIDVDTTTSLASAITGLLSALTDKAGDFSSVGATSIVAGDIKSLQQPAADIVSDIVKAVQSDCDKVGSLTSALGDIAGAFSSADSAYSVDPVDFPSAPSCSGGSGSSSAASSEASSAATSAAATSAAASSAAGSSAASSVAAAATSASAPAAVNGGVEAVVGLGAAAAGVAALLI